jgi:hypothetical protein
MYFLSRTLQRFRLCRFARWNGMRIECWSGFAGGSCSCSVSPKAQIGSVLLIFSSDFTRKNPLDLLISD